MSEMLANHYFLTRNFKEAIATYEKAFSRISIPKKIVKRLIICYVHTKQLNKALSEFYKIINEDIDIILTSNIEEDLPCPEIIPEIEDGKLYMDENEKNLALGILWLYCDALKSEYYFLQYQRSNPDDKIIAQTIQLIQDHLTQKRLKGEKV